MVFTTEGFLEVAIESWPEWDLNPRYVEIYGEETFSMSWSKWFFTTLSQIFENVFKTLTEWKFEISFLLGFPSLRGTTRATSVKIKDNVVFYTDDWVKSGVKKSTVVFISHGGMVSIPVAFLEINPCKYKNCNPWTARIIFTGRWIFWLFLLLECYNFSMTV